MTLLMAGAGVVAAYAAAGAIRISEPRIVTRAARTHLLALGALLLVLMAWRYRLDQFALVLQHEDAVVPGATYTDVHVRLPILRTLMVLSVAGAVLCLYASWRRVSLPVAAAAGAVVIALVGVSAAGRGATNLVEHLAVDPQALSRERPYVCDSIAFTRKAFQLDGVRRATHVGGGEADRRGDRTEPGHPRQRLALGLERAAAGNGRAPVDRDVLQIPQDDRRPVHGRRPARGS